MGIDDLAGKAQSALGGEKGEQISDAALDKLRSSPHTIWLRTYAS